MCADTADLDAAVHCIALPAKRRTAGAPFTTSFRRLATNAGEPCGLFRLTLYHVQVGIIEFGIEATLKVLGDDGMLVFLALVQK